MAISTYPKFITNQPVGSDLLESGAHKRTAESIAAHIKAGDTGFKLIGLDGAWGSGKSNVISIIGSELGTDFHIFLYDAWSHQEDLQRRSFLEELTDDLTKASVIDSSKWQEALTLLLAKKKDTITTNVPKLSDAIIVAILTTVLLPITKTVAEKIDCTFWKIFVVASPLIAALLLWAWAAWKFPKYRSFKSLFYLYKEELLRKTVNETISEKEPSVREFRKWMEELSGDLQKNVVIVFDNMDRLPADKVQRIWSSIHTFFSGIGYPKMSVIVPFDRKHINEAFSGIGNNDDKANHFINKTFSVLFNVSPAVLTDWNGFFKLKYREAFGETENEDYTTVKTIFDLYTDIITPRNIIAFINDLVALKITWKEIAIRYQALFVLNREAIGASPREEILEGTYLEKAKVIFREDNTVADNIAALFYNVPVDMASQVTLYREILNNIRETNYEALTKISTHPKYYEVLEEVISKENIDLVSLVSALNNIERSRLGERETIIIDHIWNLVISRQMSEGISSFDLTTTQQSIIKNATPARLPALLRSLCRKFVTYEKFHGGDFYNVLSKVKLFLADSEIDIDVLSVLDENKLSPDQFLSFIKNGQADALNYKVYCDNDALDSYLADDLTNRLDSARFIWTVNKVYHFPKLKAAIEAKLDTVTIENIVPLFIVYRMVSSSLPLDKKLSDVRIDELLTLADKTSDAYYELAAMRMARGAAYSGTSAISNPITVSNQIDVIENVSSRIESYSEYGNLLKEAISWSVVLLTEVCKRLTLAFTSNSKLNIREILPLFSKIIVQLQIPEEALWAKLDQQADGLTQDEIKTNLTLYVPDTAEFIPILNSATTLCKNIREAALSYLAERNEAEWSTSFSNLESYDFLLLTSFVNNGQLTLLPLRAVDAYKNSLIAIAKGEITPIPSIIVWENLYQHCDKSQLTSTIKNIRDLFLNTVDIDAARFLFFESALREQGELGQRAADSVRRIVTVVLPDPTCFSLLHKQVNFYAPLVCDAGEDGIDFIKGLRRKNEATPNSESQSFETRLNEIILFKTPIEIQHARYYTEKAGIDVKDQVNAIIWQEKRLHFIVGNDITSNIPEGDQPKKLEVKYKFKNIEYTQTVDEGEWISLP